MKSKGKQKAPAEITVKTTLTFEQLMQKALATPLPPTAKKKKKK